MAADDPTRIYVCYERDSAALAARLDAWPRTNADAEEYLRRLDTPMASAAAEPIRARLREQIRAADVTVCLVGDETSDSAWIAWEIEESKRGPSRNGLVAVKLQEYSLPPTGIMSCGAIFVSFQREKVARAIEWAAGEPHSDEDYTLVDD
jgi:hypothetical protein